MSDPADELDSYIDNLINAELGRLITEEIGPSTCQFLKQDEKGDVIPFASGVLVVLKESYFILTASHVIEDWSDQNKLFVEIKEGYMSIAGKGCGSEIGKEAKIDIAYIQLKDTAVVILKEWYKFLPFDRLLCNEKMLDEANYCVYGYPVANPKNNKGKTIGAAYFVRPHSDKVFEYFGFDPFLHYVLEFRGKATNITTGINEKIRVEHYGLSGGGLWYLEINHDGDRFISCVYLIGIMSEFRRAKYDSLIANRLENVLGLIYQNEGIQML